MAITGVGRPSGLPKTGGRRKGTPNKGSLTVAEKMELLGCDPIAGMVDIAMNVKNSPETRGRYYSELAQYLYPKRKALEISDEQSTDFNVNTNLDTSEGSCQRQVEDISSDEPSEIEVDTNLPNSGDSNDDGEPQS